MKKFILASLLMSAFFLSYAYPVFSYARVEATEKVASYKLGEIKVIIGDKVKDFATLEDAFKYLGDNGYELVAAYASNKSKDTHHFYTFKRKESD